MTDFEIFGIVNMGNRRSDDEREPEEVAQRLSHDTRLGRGRCHYDPELRKTEKGKLKRSKTRTSVICT
ncbi:hypothetical protein [Ruminococcus sp. AM43-6]|uniref:hypothetical protein n=1 Tax=unclassified Ruminococcus TaxID=2608920 RepID=UPI0011C11E1E|nr:hypothetical protein [Ruminococcus sp. AM43-6]UYJ30724.1 MAG: hypothetical protein OGM18_08880 [Oscillospiraceae bacterium]